MQVSFKDSILFQNQRSFYNDIDASDAIVTSVDACDGYKQAESQMRHDVLQK